MLGEAVGAWDSFELTPDEFYEDGDTVGARAHEREEGRSIGEDPGRPHWRPEGGPGKRLQILTDTHQGPSCSERRRRQAALGGIKPVDIEPGLEDSGRWT